MTTKEKAIYRQLKQEVRKELKRLADICIKASKGKSLGKNEYWMASGDISDLINDYISILRDQIDPHQLNDFLFARDTMQREYIPNNIWNKVYKLTPA